MAEAEELKTIEMEARKSVEADAKKARTDAEIDVSELYNDVYENNLEGKIRGLVPWERHEHRKTQQALNV